jgi:transcriptional antiterminator RfaH
MPYWACARLETNRERLALHCLGLAGYQVYLPRIRVRKLKTAALFPGYAFVWIELQWHAARWSPGVLSLVLDGVHPAKVPDKVIAELRGRERDGLIELLPPPGCRRGDQVHITRGVFTGQSGGVRRHAFARARGRTAADARQSATGRGGEGRCGES